MGDSMSPNFWREHWAEKAMFSDAGAEAAKELALGRALRAVRIASDGGKKSVTKGSVLDAAKSDMQTGGRTVMSMSYYGQGGAPFPQEYFGRRSAASCPMNQCGGSKKPAAGVPTVTEIKKAADAEGIKITSFGVKAAHGVAADYVTGTLKPLLRHDYPGSKKWSATQVKKAAA